MSMWKFGGRLEVGGWLPVSLTELGHWHGFIVFPDDGAVIHCRWMSENKKEGNGVGSPKRRTKRQGEHMVTCSDMTP